MTANYVITPVDGTLTINPAALTITADSANKEYDGQPLTDDGWQDTAPVGLKSTDTVASVTVTGTITEVGSEANVASGAVVKNGETDVTSNYNITYVDGTLTITTSSKALKVVSADGEWTYDGDAHTKHEYTVTYGTESYTVTIAEGVTNGTATLSTGDVVTITPAEAATITHAAETTVDNAFSYTVENSNQYSNQDKEEGKLTVTPATLTVMTEGATKEYDGTALTADGSISGFVTPTGGEKETATFTVTGSQIEVGTSDNTYIINWNGTAVESDYTISKTLGTLEVTASTKELKVVSANGEWTYDGNAHTKYEYTVTYGEESYTVTIAEDAETGTATLSTGDVVTITPAGGTSITHVKTTGNDTINAFNYTVENSDQYSKKDKTEGTLKILPATLTIVTESDSKEYDGTALTAKGSISGFVTPTGGEQETATFKVTGSQTEVGKSNNTYTLTWDGTALESDYTLDETIGELEVTVSTKELKVVSVDGSWTYDGNAHTKYEYTVTYGTESYTATVAEDAAVATATLSTGDVVTITPAEAATITHVAETTVDNAFRYTVENSDQYSNQDKEEGTLTITPATLTIVTEGATKAYDGTELTAAGNISGFVTPTGGEKETATFAVTGSQTEVGKSDNTYTLTWDGTAVESDYTLAKTIGELEVTASKTELNVVSADGEWEYDGTAHTKYEYTVTYGEESYTVTIAESAATGMATLSTGDVVTITPARAATITHVAETTVDNAFSYTVANSGFYAAQSKEEGELTVTAATLTIVTEGATKEYDGTALTADGSIDGFVKNETATFAVTGSQTTVGKSDNTYTLTWNGTAVESDYDLDETIGKLEVTASTKELKVVSADGGWTYDGDAHTKYEYTVTYGEEEYSVTIGAEAATGIATLSTGDVVTITPAEAATITNVAETPVDNAFSYTVANSAQYSNQAKDEGALTVTARSVTLTSATDSKVYDGTALTNDEITVGGEGFAEGEGATYDVTGSQTEVGNSANAFEYTLNEGTKADNYNITKTEGTLTVTALTDKVTVTITEHSGEAKYDGIEKTVTGYDVDIDNELYTEKDFTFSGNDTIKGTNAGTYDMGLKPADFTNISKNFTNVEFVIEDGTLEIAKRSVTLTSATDSKVYDGKALTNDTVTVSGDGFVTGEGATYEVKGTITDIGEVKNNFDYTLNADTLAKNYEIEKVFGTLTVTALTDKVTVTITEHGGSEKYDGIEKTVTGYDVSIDNELYTENDFTFSGDATIKGTDAGTYDMALKPADFTNTSANFAEVEFVIVDGQLAIAKRAVILTSADDEKVYDGTALKNDTVTVTGDGFAANEGATYSVTGSQTEVGESANAFEYTLNEGTKAANYDITKKEGTLKVTAVTDKVTVTITEHSGSEKYDGSEMTVTGYTVTSISNELYTEADFTFTGDATVKGTDAGTYNMELKPADFTNTNKNFENVEFVIVDGKLEIAKRSVTLTSADDSKTYDGKALTNDEITVTGDGFAEGEGAAYDVTGSQTLVGSGENKFSYTLNEGTKAGNYDIETVFGTLIVTDGQGEDEKPVDDSLVVTKTAADKAYALREEVTFDIEATNIYAEAKTIRLSEQDGVTIEQSVFEGVEPGATVTTTATYTIKEADILAGEFTNKVTATIDKLVKEATETVETENLDTTLSVKKEITNKPADGRAFKLDETIEYKITVTNEGNASFSNVKVVDEKTGLNETIELLAVGESREFKTTHVVSEEDIVAGSYTNTVTAAADPIDDPKDPENPKTPEDDDEVTTGSEPDDPNPPIVEKDAHLTITKETEGKPADGEAYKLGEEITYKITVKNDGNVTVRDITVTDELTGDKWTIDSLGVNKTKEFTAKHAVTEEDILAGSVVNVATATGTAQGGDPEVDPGEDEEPVEDKNGNLVIEKVVTSETPEGGYKLGDTVEYKITVTNDGNLTITDIEVEDSLTGETWFLEALAPGASKDFDTTYTVGEKDVEAGKIVNTATAAGTSPDPDEPGVEPEPGEAEVPVAKHYTVVYTDGVDNAEVFADQRFENLTEGEDTPTVDNPTRASYRFNGWQPAVKATVQAADADENGEIIYTATWKKINRDKPEEPDTPDEPDEPPVEPDEPIDEPDEPIVEPEDPNAGAEIDEPDVPLAPVEEEPEEPAITNPVPFAPAPYVPEEEGEVVEPEEQPFTPVEVAEVPTIIDEPVTPTASGGGWALINLILAGVAALSAIFALTAKKDEVGEDEDEDKAKKHRLAKLGAAAIAVAAVATFLLTEDMSQNMVMVDKWTLLMGLYAIGDGLFTYKARKGQDEEEQPNA